MSSQPEEETQAELVKVHVICVGVRMTIVTMITIEG